MIENEVQQPQAIQKRPRGDGRIFLRGKTFWCAFSVNGREHRESTKTADAKAAEKYLRSCIKRVHVHEANPEVPFITSRDRRRTVGDLMDALKVNFELRGKASLQNLSNIRRIKKDFGDTRALALTADGIARYVADRREEGYANATINRLTETLRAGFVLAELPAPKIIKLDESHNVRSGFFSNAEIRKVIANLPSALADFTLFGWLTGMRKSEISSLTWENYDGDSIRLRADCAKNGNARLIPLEGELVELMERRKAARQVKSKNAVTLSAFIFHRGGAPIKEFRKAWSTACRLAGVRRLFHDLRRSAVRNMLAAGVSEHVARQVSGHKTASMLHRYAIVSEGDLRSALGRTQVYLKETAEAAAKAALTMGTTAIQ
jgi:integrase